MSQVNAPGQYKNSDFAHSILPFVKQAASRKNIFWGSGDIGTQALNSQLFFHHNDNDRVTYFATGLDDRAQDAIVRVNVDRN